MLFLNVGMYISALERMEVLGQMGRGKPEAFTDVWNISCISFAFATTHNEVRDHRDFQSSLLLDRNLDFPDLFYEKQF